MNQAILHYITPDAERHIAQIARISSTNPDNPEFERLLRYMIEHSHWSPFEQAHATFLISTSRAISAQIMRHWSFRFQEHSQRYNDGHISFVWAEARAQGETNRQSSIDSLDEETKAWFKKTQIEIATLAMNTYYEARQRGIARECARFLLPMNTNTRFYMTGDLRSWIHYVNLRAQPDTQAEHAELAHQIKAQLSEQLPTIAAALGWQARPTGATLQ